MARTRLRELAAQTHRNIQDAENKTDGAYRTLATSMRRLNTWTRLAQKRIRCADDAKNQAETRQREQYCAETALLLNIASPVLEAEKLIDRDRLRTSVVEHDDSVEPFVYAESNTALTHSQRNELFNNYLDSVDSTGECQAVVDALVTNQSESFDEFMDLHPESSMAEFDRLNLWYSRQARQQLVEAQIKEHDLHNEVVKAGFTSILREYDFAHAPGDDEPVDSEPYEGRRRAVVRSREQRARIEEWVALQGGMPPIQQEDSPPVEAKQLDAWHVRPIDFQDIDRGTNDSFGDSERRLCGALLPKYRLDCADMREDLSIFSEHSEYSECWCCGWELC
ncbi:hypothetical protein LTR37_008064 [Vermiconidia calcicola]|uniref:Uncharacterized protein n=1 Tax=Vermiconidia calcicola TaxID=1690605 RepID=A0ACC3NBP3_9PEZI|nr:hypothetical protein LTR37_008064 [Vermiconidia calcicola]